MIGKANAVAVFQYRSCQKTLDPCVLERAGVYAVQPVDLALLGNSITLTPGTLTLDVHEGRLLVHALTPEGAAALERGEMQRRVAALRAR